MGNAARKLKLLDGKPDDLHARAAVERAQQDDLETAARAAEHAAQLAQLAFEDAPTAEASRALFGPVAVAQQQARRARRIADENAVRIGAVLREARIESETARLALLRERIGGNTRSPDFMPARDRVADLVANFRRDLKGALAELREKLEKHNTSRHEATSLAQSLVTGEDFGAIKLDDVIAGIVAPLSLANWEHTGSGHVRLLCFTPNGQPGTERYTFEVSGPLVGGDK